MSQTLKAEYVSGCVSVDKCPQADLPEYAFIGRSNVGKSSLINMLTGKKGLAKTSSTPGKTRIINHFIIDELWYLVDLPGYGYARVSKKDRQAWETLIHSYLTKRKNLAGVFILVDARHEPQPNDLQMMSWLIGVRIPFVILFTKSDKLTRNQLKAKIATYLSSLPANWRTVPHSVVTASTTGLGREEVLDLIEEQNRSILRNL